jgi:hypothetical protein
MGKIVALHRRPSSVRLQCSACGAEANAACDCGAPYVSAASRAADALAKDPDKSDRAIADEIGVSNQTVKRARAKTTVTHVTVRKRKGKDGKTRKLPRRPEPQINDPVKEINGFHRELLGFLTDFTQRFHKWHDAAPLISKDGKAELMQAFYLCADGFAHLAQKLDGR